MEKVYDFDKAKEIINSLKNILTASLGMIEDWGWTAQTIFEDKKFIDNYDKLEEIAGIGGSAWATPTLCIEFEDGSEENFDCYKQGTQEFTAQQIEEMKSFARNTGGKPKE